MPALENPLDPATTVPMVAVVEVFTVMTGWLAPLSSVSGSPVPGLSVQPKLGVTSPNIMLPIVRAPSKVTVALAVRSKVLKSAVTPAPVPMNPPAQLPAVAQLPPAGLVQVGIARTVMLSVASSYNPPASVTRTVKTFTPTLPVAGVPPMVPLDATVSHDGPEILENVSVSPRSGSVAGREPEAAWPFMANRLIGSALKAGARLPVT